MLLLKKLYHSLGIIIILNVLLKPVWIFLVENKLQHIIGNANYGEYYSLYNLAIISSIIIDFGLTQYFIVNSNAIETQIVKKQIGQLIIIKIFLSLIFIILLSIIAKIFGFTNTTLLLLIALQQIITALISLLRCYFSLKQQYNIDGIFSIADKLLSIIIFTFILYFFDQNIIKNATSFVLLQVITSSCILVTLLIVINNIYTTSQLNIKTVFTTFKKAVPFAIMILCMAIVLKSDILLLKLLHKNGAAEAGIFASGYRILDALNSFGFLIAGIFFPFYSNNLHNKQLLTKTTKQLSILLIGGSLLLVIITFIYKTQLSNFLFIQSNSATTQILWNCTVGFVGYALIHIYSTILTANKMIKPIIITSLIFIGVVFFMHLLITPFYGALGVSFITAFVPILYGVTFFIICKYKKLL